MEGYLPLKMKRKELEVVEDDFSDFPVMSPARKMRRLDAELPPIVDDDVEPSPVVPEFAISYNSSSSGGVKIEELPTVPENEERAIVLFKPVNSSLLHSPFSISVNPDLVSGFKNQVPLSNKSSSWRLDSDEATEEDNNTPASSNGCLAVVPWVPPQPSSAPPFNPSSQESQIDYPDTMDAQEMEEVLMDVEESMSIEQRNVNDSRVGVSEGLHQWNQHCMIPQPPQNTSTPIICDCVNQELCEEFLFVEHEPEPAQYCELKLM